MQRMFVMLSIQESINENSSFLSVGASESPGIVTDYKLPTFVLYYLICKIVKKQMFGFVKAISTVHFIDIRID